MTDRRKRILINDKQLSFWTWDKEWTKKDRGELVKEYLIIRDKMPELFPTGTPKY